MASAEGGQFKDVSRGFQEHTSGQEHHPVARMNSNHRRVRSLRVLDRNKACTNDHVKCQSWADRGECTGNSGYMVHHCGKACNNCNQVVSQVSDARADILCGSADSNSNARGETGAKVPLNVTRTATPGRGRFIQVLCPQSAGCSTFVLWLCARMRDEASTPVICLPDIWNDIWNGRSPKRYERDFSALEASCQYDV